MTKQFKSNNYLFRPTALAEALAKASNEKVTSFVREPKAQVVHGLRDVRVLQV